jgi:hypothetical protein
VWEPDSACTSCTRRGPRRTAHGAMPDCARGEAARPPWGTQGAVPGAAPEGPRWTAPGGRRPDRRWARRGRAGPLRGGGGGAEPPREPCPGAVPDRREGGRREGRAGRAGRAAHWEREGEGGREARGGEAHFGIRRSVTTVHRITPRAREVEVREREVAAREKKMKERGGGAWG